MDQEMNRRAAEDLNSKFPGFSDLAKVNLFKVYKGDYKKKEAARISKDTDTEYLKLKDRYQDKYGQTYLMELDCWNWARYVENVCSLGHYGDTAVNGRQRDMLMNAPNGEDMQRWNRFLFYSSAFLYKAARLFTDVRLFTFLFYLPLFFFAVFLAVLYSFCLRFYGIWPAVVSCLFVGLSPVFLPRSCAGWFDTDILNLLFPLTAVFFYILSYGEMRLRRRVLFICLASFFVSLFAWNWSGWGIAVMILAVYEIYSFADLFSARLQFKEDISREIRTHLFCSGILAVSSLFFVLALCGLEPLQRILSNIKELPILNDPLTISVWPNVYSTVGELKKPDFKEIANLLGGLYLFICAVSGMMAMLLRNKHYAREKRESIFMMIIWFIVIFLLLSKGVRFTAFLLIPMGILLGAATGECLDYIRSRKGRLRRTLFAVFGVISVVMGVEFWNNGWRTAASAFPMMNDTWYSVMTTIREKTPAGAIVNSWWDYGDFFKVAARRRVIFDGQSQNTPQAFWMARVLTTTDEKEAVGILRMLNNGGNRAYEIVNDGIHDPFQSVTLLRKIMLMSPEEGFKELSLYLTPSDARKVSGIMYAKPGPAYFVVDSSMSGKMPSISYLGNWVLAKVYIAQNTYKRTRPQMVEYLSGKLGVDKEQADKFCQEAVLLSPDELQRWISSKYAFYGQPVAGQLKDDLVLFDNGSVYNPGKQAFYSYSEGENRFRSPKSVFISVKGELTERVYPQGEGNFSAVIKDDAAGYQLLMMSPELARSTFVRLNFLKGAGMEHFTPFTEENDGSQHIGVFEIKWD